MKSDRVENVIAIVRSDVLSFHDQLEKDDEQKIRNGIRDIGLIDSAVNTPFQECFGVEMYPTIFGKASHLGYFLAKNHGFEDGNKRTALHSMLFFLLYNGIGIKYDDDEMEDVICRVADGSMSVEDLEKWLETRSFPAKEIFE